MLNAGDSTSVDDRIIGMVWQSYTLIFHAIGIGKLFMGNFMDKGNDGFASVCNSNFVDKSMLIENVNSVMLTENRYMCVTRARRFGKSVAVKMLNAYYDRSCNSRKLFEGLKISAQPDFDRYLNRFPVLYLDMTDFVTKYGGEADIVERMKRDICEELLRQFDGISMDPNDDLMDLLVRIVESTGEKFICLIDEWDALCREGQERQMDEYVDFLRRLFKGSKTEYVFACAYLTGILPIKRYNTQSALNNFEEYTMLSPAQLAPYFGFTETEVSALCESFGMDAHQMKLWYDGYELGNEKAMYNPFAVMRALKRKSFASYWASTNTFENLRRYITMNFDGLKDDIVSTLNDIPVKVNSLRFSNDMHEIDCKDDVLTLLCHLGYLSFNDETKCAVIPNYEVRQEFETAIADSGWAEVTDALSQSDRLLTDVLNGDSEAVAAGVDMVHERNTSVLQYNDENSLACVLSLAFYTARSRYEMIRELPTGKGFADLVLVPHRNADAPAIVLELKYNLDADTAISQIKRQSYGEALKSYFGDVILTGINYDRKTKKHSCVIERVEKSNTNAIKSNTNSKESNTKNPFSKRQRLVLDYCHSEAHTALEIFTYLGIGKQAKHYNVYIKALLDCGALTDATPEIRRNKKYITSNTL